MQNYSQNLCLDVPLLQQIKHDKSISVFIQIWFI